MFDAATEVCHHESHAVKATDTKETTSTTGRMGKVVDVRYAEIHGAPKGGNNVMHNVAFSLDVPQI
jgi:hypothetical protein